MTEAPWRLALLGQDHDHVQSLRRVRTPSAAPCSQSAARACRPASGSDAVPHQSGGAGPAPGGKPPQAQKGLLNVWACLHSSLRARRCIVPTRRWHKPILVTSTERSARLVLRGILAECKAAAAAQSLAPGDPSAWTPRHRWSTLVIGMDVEHATADPDNPGQRAAIVQLAMADFVVIIPLAIIGGRFIRSHGPQAVPAGRAMQLLRELLELPYILKCGVGIRGDVRALAAVMADEGFPFRARYGSPIGARPRA